MAIARTTSESGFDKRTETKAPRPLRGRATEKDALAGMSPSDRANHINRNMDRLAPKTRAKLDAYQTEGHATLPRDHFKGLSAEEIRARILSGK